MRQNEGDLKISYMLATTAHIWYAHNRNTATISVPVDRKPRSNGKRELMDTSLQNTNIVEDQLARPTPDEVEAAQPNFVYRTWYGS